MDTDNPIARLLGDPNVMRHAFRLARLRAIRMHQISGEPLVYWRDGAMVYLDPDEALRQWEAEPQTSLTGERRVSDDGPPYSASSSQG